MSDKPTRIDPIASLMRRRRAEPEAAYSEDEVDKLLSHYKQLQQQVEAQQGMISNLQQNALSDPVTGLANQRTLQSEVEKSLATARRYGRRHALLKIEVNDFDGFDAMGPETAVAVLTHIARVLRQSIRPTDIAARPHGAEFCVILNELRMIENAEMRATEIAKAIAGAPCITPQHSLHISVTTGAYVFGAEDEVEDIFSKAEQAMVADSHEETVA